MNDDTSPSEAPPDDPLAAIKASRLGPAQKTALRLLAEGKSYREAARQAGLRSTADLKRHAQRFGLVEAHNRARRALVVQEREWTTAELIESMRQVAGRGAEELLRRLEEEPESIATRDLSVLTGVALDKIAKHERWDEEDSWERGVPDHVAKLLDALGTRGATAKVEVAARVTVGSDDTPHTRSDQTRHGLLQQPLSGPIEVLPQE